MFLALSNLIKELLNHFIWRGETDPTATIGAVAMLLEHIGRVDDAARVRAAVRADMAARAEVNAAGAPLVRSTSEVGDAIAAALRR